MQVIKIILMLFVLVVLATPLSADTAEVITGYGYFIDASGHIVSKANLPAGLHPMKDGYGYVEVASKQEMDAVEIYTPPAPLLYSAESLLAWCMENILSVDPIASMETADKAILINYTTRFADNATDSGAYLFRTVATDLSMVDLANTIIAKAIELGAEINA